MQKFIRRHWKQIVATKHAGTVIVEPLVRHSYAVKDGHIKLSFLVTCVNDLTSQGNLCKAFKTFSSVQRHARTHQDSLVDSIAFLLFASSARKSTWQGGRQLHGHMISLGLQKDPVLVPKPVTYYSNFESLVDCHAVVENANIMDPLPWTLLIVAYGRNELYGKALSAYMEMRSKGVRPNNFTYPSVLKACGKQSDLAFGKEVHSSIKPSNHRWSLFVHNSLISMYNKTGELEVVQCLFDEMLDGDVVSWNSIIGGYASKGMWKEANELFERMESEVGKMINNITWNTFAKCCSRSGNFLGV